MESEPTIKPGKWNDKQITNENLQIPRYIGKLFGYSPQRNEGDGDGRETEKGETAFVRHRIFLNHGDQFNGKHIAKFLCEKELEETETVPETEEKEEELEENEGPEESEEEYKEETEEDTLEDLEAERDGSSEAEEENAMTEDSIQLPKNHKLEIIGTLKDPGYKVPEDISEIVEYSSADEIFLSKILSCGFVVYDITRDTQQINEAAFVLQAIEFYLDSLNEEKPKAFMQMKEVRTFILISTMMTWALTKPLDPEEPDLPFAEDDYRKRKPHPNYKEHIKLERSVTKVGRKYKDKFRTLVVTTGIPYGEEEDILHFLFRMAWENEQHLPILLPGTNNVPLIHVRDLACIIYNLIRDFPEKAKFVFAVEPNITTLTEIVKSMAKAMGTGKTKLIQKENALLYREITQEIYDLLNINLNVDPIYIMNNMEVEWKYELPFSENAAEIVQEFKNAKKFKPLKIFIHGPPAIGKTTLCKRLCDHYKLHYIDADSVVQDTIQQMKDIVEKREAKERDPGREGEEDEEDEDESFFEENEGIIETLQEIEDNLERTHGKLDEEYKIKFIKQKLLGNQCQNQGYVLDGYPSTVDEAKMTFDVAPDDDDMPEEDDVDIDEELLYNIKIIPEFVFSLEASDDYLIDKFVETTAQVLEENMDELLQKRLEEYRKTNEESTTVLNYFDEREIHPEVFSVVEEQNPYLENTFRKICDIVGKPRNYGPSQEELLEKAKEEEKVKMLEEEQRKERIEEEKKMAREEHFSKLEKYANLLNAAKEKEEELLAKKAIPIRHYLMKYVIPVLTKGLLEVAKVRPVDPVDYLAEYLFKQNPDGKMFEHADIESSDGSCVESCKRSLASVHSETYRVRYYIRDIVQNFSNNELKMEEASKMLCEL